MSCQLFEYKMNEELSRLVVKRIVLLTLVSLLFLLLVVTILITVFKLDEKYVPNLVKFLVFGAYLVMPLIAICSIKIYFNSSNGTTRTLSGSRELNIGVNSINDLLYYDTNNARHISLFSSKCDGKILEKKEITKITRTAKIIFYIDVLIKLLVILIVLFVEILILCLIISFLIPKIAKYIDLDCKLPSDIKIVDFSITLAEIIIIIKKAIEVANLFEYRYLDKNNRIVRECCECKCLYYSKKNCNNHLLKQQNRNKVLENKDIIDENVSCIRDKTNEKRDK